MAVLKRFLAERSGNVATIFGIVILPVLMLLGIGVEYGRIAKAEGTMQQTVDSSVRSLVTDIGRRRIDAEREIEGIINANSGRDSAKVDISIHQNKLRVDAVDEIDTPLLSMIGRPKSQITARVELDAPTTTSTGGQTGALSQIDRATIRRLERQTEDLIRQLRRSGRLSNGQLRQIERNLERQIARIKRQAR